MMKKSFISNIAAMICRNYLLLLLLLLKRHKPYKNQITKMYTRSCTLVKSDTHFQFQFNTNKIPKRTSTRKPSLPKPKAFTMCQI